MKFKNPTLLLILMLISSFSRAQQPSSKDQQEVQQTVINFFEALSNRDSISLKKYCTVDITLFENGSIWNADTLILKAITLNTAPDFKRVNSFDFINTTLNQNTAWASYHLTSEMSKTGKQATIQWMETVVVIKDHKKWKIKVLHSTLIKRT